MLAASLSWAAQVAGTIVNLSGPLMAKKANGSVKVLALKSEVEQGDTLVAEKSTYAQIRFIDNSEMTLKPNTTFVVEKFDFDAGKPEGDSASFNLVKGGLRSVTGLLGKRNKEKFALKTPTATIGIRGTTFIVDYVESDEQAVAALNAWLMASTAGPVDQMPVQPLLLAQTAPPKGPSLAPGLYVQVIDGLINLTNKGGAQLFSAGQFGFTPNVNVPPIVVPKNPGIQFTPPPVFNNASSGPTRTTSAKSNTVDCEVRLFLIILPKCNIILTINAKHATLIRQYPAAR